VIVLVVVALTTGGAVVISAAGSVRHAIRCTSHRCHCSVPVRWFSGRPMNGEAVSDAGLFRRGTPLNKGRHNGRFHCRPGWQRRAWRTGPVVALMAVLAGLVTAPAVTLAVITAVFLAAAGLAGWRLWVTCRRWRHHRTYVRPLHRRIAPEIGVPVSVRGAAYLEIPEHRHSAIVHLPEDFDPAPKALEAVQRHVTQTLALEAPDVKTHLAGRDRQITFTQSKPPPGKVPLADIRQAIAATGPDDLVIGIGKKDVPVDVSLNSDSPHLGISAGSGAGKSVTARLIAAQVLYKGGIVLVLDFKLISHHWARGLPNVAYAARPAEIHTAACWLAEEITRRNEVAMAGADIEGEVHANVGPRILVVAEELNATMGRLKAHWREIREKGDPATSPAIAAIEEGLATGRQARVNFLLIGQRLSAKATGSGSNADARENIGAIIMARYTKRTVEMLAPDRAIPAASSHVGRVQVVTATAVRETQVGFLTGREARAFATAGTVGLPRADMPFVTSAGPVSGAVTDPAADGVVNVSNPSSGDVLTAVRGMPAAPVTAGPGPVPVSLTEAVAAGLVRGTKRALQMDRWRDPAFPAPVGYRGQAQLFDAAELAAYDTRKRGERVA